MSEFGINPKLCDQSVWKNDMGNVTPTFKSTQNKNVELEDTKLCDQSGVQPKEVDEIGKALKNLGTAKTTIKLGDDLKDAKVILSDMMAGGDVTSLKQEFKLDSIIENMDAGELGEFAAHVSNLIKNTDGKDGMLNRILDKVINELKTSPGPDKKPDFPFHIIDNNEGGPIMMKYTCSYNTRKIAI